MATGQFAESLATQQSTDALTLGSSAYASLHWPAVCESSKGAHKRNQPVSKCGFKASELAGKFLHLAFLECFSQQVVMIEGNRS